jgi:hypothetical protein
LYINKIEKIKLNKVNISMPKMTLHLSNHFHETDEAEFRNWPITEVIIPPQITSISDYTFDGCRNLKTVVVGPNIRHIGMAAFQNCASIETIVFPIYLNSFGESAFQNCSLLNFIVIPVGVLIIPANMLEGCSSLTRVFLARVRAIESEAFFHCTSLQHIEFPDTLRILGSYVFAGCPIKELTIPEFLVDIASDAFAGMNQLTTLHLVMRNCIDNDELLSRINHPAFVNFKRVVDFNFIGIKTLKLTMGPGIITLDHIKSHVESIVHFPIKLIANNFLYC